MNLLSKTKPGSTTKRFDRIISVERDPEKAAALKSRLHGASPLQNWEVVEADFNLAVSQVADRIPDRSLNVAFVDPYSLDVRFDAIEVLARRRPLDLVVLVSDRIDLQRNVEDNYYTSKSDKLDQFLGNASGWRAHYDKMPDRSGGKLRELFGKLYVEQLHRIGYLHSDHWPLEGPLGPMFRLVFASKHELGLKYCDIARKEDFGGEVGLYG